MSRARIKETAQTDDETEKSWNKLCDHVHRKEKSEEVGPLIREAYKKEFQKYYDAIDFSFDCYGLDVQNSMVMSIIVDFVVHVAILPKSKSLRRGRESDFQSWVSDVSKNSPELTHLFDAGPRILMDTIKEFPTIRYVFIAKEAVTLAYINLKSWDIVHYANITRLRLNTCNIDMTPFPNSLEQLSLCNLTLRTNLNYLLNLKFLAMESVKIGSPAQAENIKRVPEPFRYPPNITWLHLKGSDTKMLADLRNLEKLTKLKIETARMNDDQWKSLQLPAGLKDLTFDSTHIPMCDLTYLEKVTYSKTGG